MSLKIAASSVYLGPNIYANWRLIGLNVELGLLEEADGLRTGCRILFGDDAEARRAEYFATR